jgi:hypothetical protein
MTIKKERNLDWLIQPRKIPWYWGAIGILCICPAGFFVGFYDSPLSGNGMGVLDYSLIFSVISFPLVCLGSSLGIWFLKDKNKKLAFYVSVLPVLPLILIFAVFAWANVSTCGSFHCESASTMQEQGNAIHAAECERHVVDGGDGLDTTGCGVLEVGVNATGITSSTLEAHNWQFSAQNRNQITITIENDGKSCPQISILDSSGSVIEGFKDENGSHLCPSGMTTTTFFYFNPPTNSTYILRLVTPSTPGAYWLKIE